MAKWQKIQSEEFCHIKESDKCFYLMEYVKWEGPKASKANSLIYNLKKDMDSKPIELKYRKRDIKQFATDLAIMVLKILQHRPFQNKLINISFIPTSKSKDDPKYNDRFDLVCNHLSQDPNIDSDLFAKPIEVLKSREKSSKSGEIRDRTYVQDLKSNFSWLGFLSKEPDILVVFDDIITTGAQFRVYSDFVFENMNTPPKIIGFFWAKAIEKEIQPD